MLLNILNNIQNNRLGCFSYQSDMAVCLLTYLVSADYGHNESHVDDYVQTLLGTSGSYGKQKISKQVSVK